MGEKTPSPTHKNPVNPQPQFKASLQEEQETKIGEENPADLPTRGLTASQLTESKLWIEGPEFLKSDESCWPEKLPNNNADASSIDVERRKEQTHHTGSHVTVETELLDPRGKNNGKILQFAPFSSAVDAGFWSSLQRKKLEEYHLDESARELRGYYVINDLDGLPSRFNLDYDALDGNAQTSKNCFSCKGELHNTNTIENFKAFDKQKLLESVGKKDLKKYQFYYWFGFPALCPENNIVLKGPAKPLTDVLTQNQVTPLISSFIP
ncbi:ubiquitin-like modifier-activating enzyme ATG7 isoform X1 [Paramuricea clavata]|uniref:Ubiquitin-like modifier-activating enzyme ATG7 isoform X1 n=1 Tax=Paramuricea clavata TaxID=317549 RepID=A0A7D9HVQ3_PARCT|nr:ubiquitin-like modifier-activating enzyme ATG7 isoform X1 [Paramuricea clavata]